MKTIENIFWNIQGRVKYARSSMFEIGKKGRCHKR